MPSELELLGSDIREIHRIVADNSSVFESLADFTDLAGQTRRMIITDLVFVIYHHVMGIHELLNEELRAPAVVVLRALFEAVVTLAYLVSHQTAEDEATILFAYSHLRQVGAFATDAALVADRQAILARMPGRLVTEAQRRMRTKPRSWSGKTIEQMAREAKVPGYETFYRYASAEAHISIVGEHVRVERVSDTEARLVTGRDFSPGEIDGMANFARRQLHGAFKTMWGVLDGPKITFHSTDPALWNAPNATVERSK